MVAETESEECQPLSKLFEALEISTPRPAPPTTPRPVTRNNAALQGVQAQRGVAGPSAQVTTSSSVSYNANSLPFYDDETERNNTEQIFLRNNKGQSWQDAIPISRELHKLFLLLDCGSPSNIVGVDNFKEVKQQYPEMIQNSFEYQESNRQYEFGGGVKTFSMGRVRLPIYVLDKNQVAHLLHVWVEVLNQRHLPLLFGGKSLIKSQGMLCFKTFTLSIQWKGKTLCLPIKQADTGHFHLQFFPMSDQEDQVLTRLIVDKADWTIDETKKILTYLASTEEPEISKIMKPEIIKKMKLRKPLTKQQIVRLHQALGHAHRDKIKDMVKNAKMYDDNTLKHIEDLANCEVCAVEHNRLPRPRISAPRSSNFGHVVAMDLKENIRYKNAPPYILYFVDTFTRFKAAVFIKNKKAGTVAEAIVTEWIKYHGAPKYLMTDRGNEWVNGEVRELCQFHGIRLTTTASYSPHQNAYVERGHAVADRALERMLTADPSLKPEVALCWVIQAVNTLQNVDGFAPFQLVFGRLPKHPSLVEDNPGNNEEVADSKAVWARHYRMSMAAREAFTAAEADKTIRKALEQRVYTDPSKVKIKDWIYFKRNHERYWKGPAKLVMKDNKNLHCIFHGQPIVINVDDVLLNKPDSEEFTMEQFVSLPEKSQPPPAAKPAASPTSEENTNLVPGGIEVPELTNQDLLLPSPVTHNNAALQGVQAQQGVAGPSAQVTTSTTDSSNANSCSFHDVPALKTHDDPAQDQQDGETEGKTEAEEQQGEDQQIGTQSSPLPATEVRGSAEIRSHQPDQQRNQPDPGLISSANSTTYSTPDLGTPLQCNLCEQETSSKNFQDHCVMSHNLQRPSIRQHATVVSAKPDSIYENVNNLKEGVVVVDEDGNYLTLVHPTALGWKVKNTNTKEVKELELIKHMTGMRYVGLLDEETEEGIYVIKDSSKVYLEYGDYTKKVFFTANNNYHEDQVYVVNIPRSKHSDPACVAAKKKELKDFENYDVYDVVDRPDNTNIIATEWVLVEKEKPDNTKVVKARLCLRGDQEEALHKIPRESPTVNKMSVKILVTLAVSQGWNIRSCDVERAFLQTEDIQRDVFVRPPVEMNLPRSKVLKLKRTAYGLVDASRSFFLKQAKEFKNIGFHPLQMDPALFIHKTDKDGMCDAGAAVHVDDALNVGKKEVLDKAQKEMQTKLTYGTVEELPFRFLGSNYRQEKNGDIVIDQKHYVESLEIPDIRELNNIPKQDILPEKFQSTFRSLASKVNVLASTVRPDFTYQAKFLTTRYNKATKSDLTAVIKLIKRAKEDTTEIVIPDIGQPEEWILVGVVDASHRTGGNLFAVGGHVLMLQNKNTQAAAVLHWASKKINRVVHSSYAAETLAMQKLFSTIYLARRLIAEMCGKRAAGLECVALTDNQALFDNIMYLKANSDDYRLHSDIIELRQSIEQDKTVQEVRYVPSSQNISDCLTKSTKNGFMLLQIVRTGQYELPGGTKIRNTTLSAVRTWNELMRVEQQESERSEITQRLDKSQISQEEATVSKEPATRVLYSTAVQSGGLSSSSAPQLLSSPPNQAPERRFCDSQDPTFDEYHISGQRREAKSFLSLAKPDRVRVQRLVQYKSRPARLPPPS